MRIQHKHGVMYVLHTIISHPLTVAQVLSHDRELPHHSFYFYRYLHDPLLTRKDLYTTLNSNQNILIMLHDLLQ